MNTEAVQEEDEVDPGQSHENAYVWLEQRKENDSSQILYFRRLRDLAAQKRRSALKEAHRIVFR